MSKPDAIINICSGVRLNNKYEHSIYFSSSSAQLGYFAGKVVKTFSAYSYLRKSWSLQVAATMEEAKTWSYLYFRNGTGKYYFYFINQIEYKNDNMVELTLELDVLQTYLFDFDLLQCFVERQHTPTDVIGEHTLEEGLEVGDLVDGHGEDWNELKGLCILVLASFNPNYADTDKPVEALPYMYDGVFSGLKVWAVDSADWVLWGKQLDALQSAGFSDGILAMWMYPKNLVKLGGEDTWNNDILCKVVDGCSDAAAYKDLDGAPETLNGYTPKNKKLLCYPYNFLYVTNNTGSSAEFKYERFNGTPSFEVKGSLSPEGVVKISPRRYNGYTETALGSLIPTNYDFGITLGGFPSCAWDSDVYKLWLAQNQNQHAIGMISGAATTAAGIATAFANPLAGAGMVAGGVYQIGSQLAQRKDMQTQPPQSRGSFSSNVNVTAGKQTFTFYRKSVSGERARVIDDYFTMYGYKLNRVQIPNIAARPAFTYVKTIGCHIISEMCNEDVTKIESIFDNGITFWKNGDKIADYSQNNAV